MLGPRIGEDMSIMIIIMIVASVVVTQFDQSDYRKYIKITYCNCLAINYDVSVYLLPTQ